jgi:hypothetical protein
MTGSKLAEKLARVSAACRHIDKDGTNLFHKYKFTSAAAVNARVNVHLAAEGLAIVDTDPSIISDVGTGKDRVVTVKVVIVVCDSETGERATFRGIGSGQDAGDKAVMKAETAAAKYAWLLGLCIAMGDDPEADDETDKRAAAAAAATQKKAAPQPAKTATTAPAKSNVNGLAERHTALIGKIDAVGSQVDAAKLWHAERATVGQLNEDLRKELWARLCVRVAKVGKMGDGDAGRKAADAWLRKALAEESARAAQENGAAS